MLAFVFSPVLLVLPEDSLFVIPAKRAGGPRELERVYSQSLKHGERSGWSAVGQKKGDATANHVACSLWFEVLPIRSTVITDW